MPEEIEQKDNKVERKGS